MSGPLQLVMLVPLISRVPIAVTVVSPHMGAHGWPFASADPFPGAENDPIHNAQHVKDIYLKVQPDFDGRCVICPFLSRSRRC